MSRAIRPGPPGADETLESSEVRRRLELAFATAAPPGVVAAYLFGSHAEGRSHRESDVDVAIHLADPERARQFVRDVQLRAADLAPFLARHRVTLLEALAR